MKKAETIEDIYDVFAPEKYLPRYKTVFCSVIENIV